MKTLAQHVEYGIIGISYYWIKYLLVVTPLIVACYSIYVDTLLGNGLWTSSVGSGGLAVTCILTILSMASVVFAVFYAFQLFANPIFRYVYYIVTIVALLFYCISMTFYNGHSYYSSLQDVSEYSSRFNGQDPQATEWFTRYNATETQFQAIDFIFSRTLGVYNAFKAMFAVWVGSFLFALVFGAYLNQELEQKTVKKAE